MYVVAAEDDLSLAETIAGPLRAAGCHVTYRGSEIVGTSYMETAWRFLVDGGAVVVCATDKTINCDWCKRISDAAYASRGRTRVYVVQMEQAVHVDRFAMVKRMDPRRLDSCQVNRANSPVRFQNAAPGP
ncbi:TIR domain-containing protein [Kibdelosporangium aridum]|uniref:TIR domain-containing protein n=1 Tax=Kibdelosporangium aridum TaxID=2030 RepID=A0A428XX67_KIBAR|nr:TIR domain-containing protein [Kibdelosporangium aridum]